MLPYLLFVTVAAYLIGAIPVGAMIAQINKVDISQHGSGKMGTTNVLRTVGRRAALAVLLGDFAKGSIAVYMAHLFAPVFLTPNERLAWLGLTVSSLMLGSLCAAVAAIAGHVWSLYLRLVTGKWQGGRGVATGLGTVLILNPLILLAALLVGIPTIVISRYVSLGSILGAVAASFTVIALVWLKQMEPGSLLLVLLALFVIAAHHDNIERLLKGTERKIGERAKA